MVWVEGRKPPTTFRGETGITSLYWLFEIGSVNFCRIKKHFGRGAVREGVLRAC